MKKITGVLFLVLLLIALGGFSYLKSKSNAIDLIGDSLEYLPLERTEITIKPYKRTSIVWAFVFSPHESSEDLYVYTNLFGGVESTEPNSLEKLLRCFEIQEYHPYSNQFLELSLQRARQGISAQRLCK